MLWLLAQVSPILKDFWNQDLCAWLDIPDGAPATIDQPAAGIKLAQGGNILGRKFQILSIPVALNAGAFGRGGDDDMTLSQQEGEAHVFRCCAKTLGDGHDARAFWKMPARHWAIGGEGDTVLVAIIGNLQWANNYVDG